MPLAVAILLLALAPEGLFGRAAPRLLSANAASSEAAPRDPLGAILARSALWLAPDPDRFPALSYTFVLRDKPRPFAFRKMPGLRERRGITLATDLDRLVAQPRRFKIREASIGLLDGRRVAILEISGERYGLEVGNGVSGTWNGYMSTGGAAFDLVVDKETSQPLRIVSGGRQIHFLDYAEVAPGRSAPLRVVWMDEERGERSMGWDFRFQVLDGRVWLLDRACGADGQVIARLEDVRLDGAPPANVLRRETVAPVKELEPFRSEAIEARQEVARETALLARIREKNRPWLNPDLKGLQSVSFVHHMEPMVLDESFAWRQDGASRLEVVARGDERAEDEIGRRWITTPEPALYYISPAARLRGADDLVLAKREKVERDFFADHFRDHLMGTRVSFSMLAWDRHPDRFQLDSLEENRNGGYTMTLIPKDRRYDVHGGAMFHTTSWAYIPGARVAKVEIQIDDQLRPIREIDLDGEGKKQCEVEFLEYRPTDDGLAAGERREAPGLIRLHFPEHKFTVEHRFAWHPEGLWILESGESRFADAAKGAQREIIRDLKINQPIPALDEALATVRTSEAYLNARPASHTLTLAVNPFVLGNRIPLTLTSPGGVKGEAGVLFTLDEKGSLVAELGVSASWLKYPRRSAIAMLDGAGRLLSAARIANCARCSRGDAVHESHECS